MATISDYLRYYKDCVFEDSCDSISASISKKEYIRVDGTELSSRNPTVFTEPEKVTIRDFIINTLRKSPSSYFWYGYPILLSKSNNGKQLKPLFYIPVGYDDEKTPELDLNNIPRINNDAFDSLKFEIAQIKSIGSMLGLYEDDTSLDFKSLGIRLKDSFPDLKYEKDEDKNIYFTGAVFSSNQLKYTKGLDKELDILLKQNITEFEESCLGYYFNNIRDNSIQKNASLQDSSYFSDLLEVYELSENQKKAVLSSFRNRITVITGPPGTGKSQVVASIILNSVLQNQKVLFSSKNHKAIQVVEEKFNQLIQKPFLIRLGKQDNEGHDLRRNLISYLNWMLHTKPSKTFENDLIVSQKKLTKLIGERNRIQYHIEDYRVLRNRILKYFNEHEELSTQTEDFVKRLMDFNKKNHIRKKHLINPRVRSIAEYIKRLNEVHKAMSFEELLNELELVNSKIKSLSTEFIKLWFEEQPNKLDGQQRRALDNFISILENLSVQNLTNEDYYRLISRKNEIQEEVSGFLQAWCVTNLSVQSEIPLIEGYFDVVVIDEASQCDIASVIPLLYRAKRVVVLGDPFQLKHITTMGEKRSIELLHKYIVPDHFNYVTRSFYHLSEVIVEKENTILLNEHFRSHADIISFSKDYPHWYNGNLIISTDYRKLNPETKTDEYAVKWVNVIGEIEQINSSGAFITNEINEVTRIAVELLSNNAFNGDIGIVSPFRSQANKIREKLNSVGLSDIQGTRILVQTTVKFQGDEKDVMIFSPVIADHLPKGVKFYLEENDYLLNVAITRARAKLIIVGNQQACINSEIKCYSSFAKHIYDLTKGRIGIVEQKSESPYEKLLYEALLDAGIKPIPQYSIGQYRLDFAIIDNNIKLDIEVDGKRYHTDWTGERLKADLVRNQRLQNLGWKVVRFWSYEIRDKMDYCVKRIKDLIDT